MAGAPWAPAAIMIALFAVAGIAVVDDYGMSADEFSQRITAQMNLDYALAGTPFTRYFDISRRIFPQMNSLLSGYKFSNCNCLADGSGSKL